MGRPGSLGSWPTLPGAQGTVGRYVYGWVLLATLPFARRYHEERGIRFHTDRRKSPAASGITGVVHSVDELAAVDVEGGAGHVAGRVREQESDGTGDVVRRADPAWP